MQATRIPSHLDEITTDWLNQVLLEAGAIQNARIASFRSEMLASQGIVGEVTRLSITYDRVEENQVPSLIAKFPSADPDLRKGLQQLYNKEILFYQFRPQNLGITVPKAYFSAFDENSGDNLLLMEDLSTNARPGNLVSGCTLEEAASTLSQLAKFHAAWWGEKHRDRYGWLPHKSDYLKTGTDNPFEVELMDWMQKIEKVIPGFRFSPAFFQSASLLAKNFQRVKNFIYNSPATIVHDDFKLDNMAFRGRQASPELVLMDWHLVCRAPAVCDLGYFVGFCLSAGQREQAEQKLLKIYFRTLCENGVQDYDFSRFLLDYRLSALEPLERFVSVQYALERLNPSLLATFQSLLNRMCSFVVDCRVGELLS